MFSKAYALNSWKYVSRPDIRIPQDLTDEPNFWSHTSIFALEKYPKNMNSQWFFTFKRSFGD